MRIIGVDPGISGAISLITESARFVDVQDMPTMNANKTGDKQQINVAELAKIVRAILLENPDVTAIMERVQPMPSIPGADGQRRGMGAASAFSFGKSVGHIEAVFMTLGISLEFVMSAQWKRAMNLPGSREQKDVARTFAQSVFPEAPLGLKKHAGRAEALLIAKWHADRLRRDNDPERAQRTAAAEAQGQAF